MSSRPPSQASTRPSSRLTHSRAPARPLSSKLSPRTGALLQELCAQLCGLPLDSPDTLNTAKAMSLELEKPANTSPLLSLMDIDGRINGIALKARVNLLDTYAASLGVAYSRIKSVTASSSGLEGGVSIGTLPNHIQFLLTLYDMPSAATLAYSEGIRNRRNEQAVMDDKMLWKEIMRDENEPDEYDVEEESLSDSLSSWDEQLSPSESSCIESYEHEEQTHDSVLRALQETTAQESNIAHREVVETLVGRQAWNRPFQPAVELSLEPHRLRSLSSMHQVIYPANSAAGVILRSVGERYITECESIREIFMNLQGNTSVFFIHVGDPCTLSSEYKLSDDKPNILFLSAVAQNSLLSCFASIGTSLMRLRSATRMILGSSQSESVVTQFPPVVQQFQEHRTLNSFALALQHEISLFDNWCADKETSFCEAMRGAAEGNQVISLLSLSMEVCNEIGSAAGCLSRIASDILALPHDITASGLTGAILDTCFTAYEEQFLQQDRTSALALLRVIMESTSPIWRDIRAWVSDGMTIVPRGDDMPITDDFGCLVQFNDVSSDEESFWTDAYTLTWRIPSLLRPVASSILSAGKSVGLLKMISRETERLEYPYLEHIVKYDKQATLPSPENILSTLREVVSPLCEHVQTTLLDTIRSKCNVEHHLNAVQDLVFMRHGDIMSEFCDNVFNKLDRGSSLDMHELNNAFTDPFSHTDKTHRWIHPALVHFTCRAHKRPMKLSVVALQGLRMSYTFPFPLKYIFQKADDIYSDVLVFLMQFQRAKKCLEQAFMLLRWQSRRGIISQSRIPRVYSLRARLAWFVEAMLSFVQREAFGLHQSFLREVNKARTIDNLSELFASRMHNIKELLTLDISTKHLSPPVIAILDLTLEYRDCLLRFVERDEYDGVALHHTLIRDMFTSTATLGHSENSHEDHMEGNQTPQRLALPPITMNDPFLTGIDRISDILEHHVNVFRSGLENLAKGIMTSASSPTLSALDTLATVLEGWDQLPS